jgi:prepilin-type processing-associated H-X9-DG protein
MPNQTLGLSNYKGVAGSNFAWAPWVSNGVAVPNASFNLGEMFLNGDGAFFAMAWKYPRDFVAVVDGLSNTLFVGEDVWHPEVATGNPLNGANFGTATPGYSWAQTADSTRSCAVPPNNYKPGTQILYQGLDWQQNQGFKSRHPGGLNFLLGDGSVRAVAQSIPLGQYKQAATMRGGEITDLQ